MDNITFYFNDTPIKGIVDVEMEESEPNNFKPLRFDPNKETTFSGAVNINNNTFLKVVGFNWRQRMWIRVRTFLYNITHKRRID